MCNQLDKAREESFTEQKWFKPETNKRSEHLVNKLKETQGLKPIYRRAGQIVNEKEIYLKELRKLKEDEENNKRRANCTFQPNISIDSVSATTSVKLTNRPSITRKDSQKSLTPTFDPENFIEKQLEYEERRQEHLKKLKQKAEEKSAKQNTYHPKISHRSREIASKRRSPLNIDKKLYAEAESKQKKLEQLRKQYMQEECPFQPSIHSSDNSPFGKTVTKSTARDALEKLTQLIETQHGKQQHEYEGLDEMSPSGTALKSILKSSNKRRSDSNSASKSPGQKKTAKKVYFRDRVRRNQVRSFHDNDGCFNIVFDKHSIRELKEHLRLMD